MKQRATNKEIVQKRAFETREKILQAALEIYAKKGYHKATVDEIAEHAGVSTGVAYRYFKNKKELLLAALEYGFSMIKELAGVKVTDVFGDDLEKHSLLSKESI
ncbi:MAG: TetR/AcrR family transcriptional regulator [Lachnospiraceae bacterium]|nr:TetR/AcrR family transcriptional regulator [Lachnospiraceae bacterium]